MLCAAWMGGEKTKDTCMCTAESLYCAPETITTLLIDCCFCGLVAKLCPTLCDPMECSPPGFSVHGISQARILEWLPFLFPGNLPHPGIQPASPAWQGDSVLQYKRKTNKKRKHTLKRGGCVMGTGFSHFRTC